MFDIGSESRNLNSRVSDSLAVNEFRKRHREIHNQLSSHQANWLFREIEADWEGYQRANQKLQKDQDDYFDWAIKYLKDIG